MPDEAFDPYWQWLGIPPHERPLDHYRLLGLPPFESDAPRIARAADERMMQVRSYQSGPRVAYSQKLLNELAAARVCLLDPNTKATYDAVLQATFAVRAGQGSVARAQTSVAAAPAPPPAAPAPPPVAPTSPSPKAGGVAPASSPSPASVASPPPLPPRPPPPPTQAAANGGTRAARAANAGAAHSSADPVAGQALGVATDGEGDDRVSLFAQPWFPAAVVAVILVVAGTVWGVGRLARRGPVDPSGPDGGATAAGGSDASGGGASGAGQSGDGSGIAGNSEMADDDEPVIIGQEATGEVLFTPGTARVHGEQLHLETVGGEEVIAGWTTPGESLTWEFRLVRPDVFRVEITYAAQADAKGAKFDLSVGEDSKVGDVLPAEEGGSPFRTDVVFLAVKKGGRHTLTFRVGGRQGQDPMALRTIRFVPKGLGSKKG